MLEQEDGRVVEGCTHDFYLPELDLYIECTSMQQRLTARKNRKYRKLRERFGVTVEIMYRRDLIRLGLLAG
jgi:hypoxanthine phosphoribosyltransferase